MAGEGGLARVSKGRFQSVNAASGIPLYKLISSDYNFFWLMAGEAGRHLGDLAAAPHYHVIAQNHDGELICSDGFTWPSAQGFVADLISPPGGAPVYEPVQTVWIVASIFGLSLCD